MAKRRGNLAALVVTVLLLTAALQFPGQLGYLREAWPVIRLWAQPEAQRRAALAGLPYDALRAADAALPADASILLVTSGRDVRHQEYTLYHRALYYLAPRPVWWLAPAAPDGTWESRWWISAPLTANAVLAVAAEKHAGYVLAVDLPQPLALGQPVADWPGAALFRLSDEAPVAGSGSLALLDASPLWPIQIALAAAILLALGYSLLALIARLGYATRGLEALALAWILGASLASITMLWLNAVGVSLRGQIALLTLLSLAGLTLRVRCLPRLRRPPDAHAVHGIETPTRNAPATPYANRPTQYASRITYYALCLALLLQLSLASLLALGRPLQTWDSWANWGIKSRTIFIENGLSPAVYGDASHAVTHLDYPLLTPLAQAWFYTWLGAPDDRFAGLIPLLFYLALGGVCYAALRRRQASQTLALAAVTALLTLPHLALLAGFGFADLPLAALAAVAVVYWIDWMEGGPPGALALAAYAAGLLPWAKREGILLLAALCLAALIAGRLRRRVLLSVGILAGAAAVLSGPWWAFVALRLVAASPDFLPVSLAAFVDNASRLSVIARLALSNLASPDWLFVWPLAALFGLLLIGPVIYDRFTRRVAGTNDSLSAYVSDEENVGRRSAVGGQLDALSVLPLTAILYLAGMALAFVFSGYAPYQQHVLSSWYRLAAQVAALPLLWIVLISLRLAPAESRH